ncbi:zinc-ribbon domain-containing protein [Methanobrevibacter gottschalkii]|uniref:Zinc-ribbon domain-containing protein n=1 Tax=Methanobrevibacter gottschalkii TaxID=190974 RepID=A0A1H7L4L7_9EURY|nr:zinc ribbon domain-containing protein [Methanobrevibacter gottschalkii]SEK93646.1 zinc-ribbon domain-containing protein [Methanobrevibacter gottschalkii]
MVVKHCPKCGNDIDDEDIEFCTECGHKLSNKIIKNSSKGFFDNLNEKTSFSVIIFSFIIFGVFLFIGSVVWSSFMANGSIDLVTYLLLVIVFSVFFGGIFVGYFGCMDESYIIPNFSIYLGSIFSVVLCGIGLIFTFLMGVISILSSIAPFGSSNSISQTSTSSYAQSVDLSFIFKLILFILLIPVISYIGVYLGYFLKKNI